MRTTPPDKSQPGGRRRPTQSRARHTALALQDALVRLLVETKKGLDSISVRELVLVAGTGLGSFYEYFASKEDLAKVTLHLRSKALLKEMKSAAIATRGGPMASIAAAMIEALSKAHGERHAEWSAHYLLERQFSGIEAYRRMYEQLIDTWAQALETASDMPAHFALRDAATLSQNITYGIFTHAYLNEGAKLDSARLRNLVTTAVCANLAAMARPI